MNLFWENGLAFAPAIVVQGCVEIGIAIRHLASNHRQGAPIVQRLCAHRIARGLLLLFPVRTLTTQLVKQEEQILVAGILVALTVTTLVVRGKLVV